MKFKPFSIERRKEFLSLSIDDVFRLFKRLNSHGQELVRTNLLPPAKKAGFRPHTDEAVKERIRRWKTYLSETVESGDKWHTVELFASGWVEFLPPVKKGLPRLKEILDGFDNAADFPEGADPIPANSPLDIKCFEWLREASRKNELDQATINDFYLVGHFRRDQAIEQIITTCNTSEQLQEYRNLLVDVEDIKEKVEELESSRSQLETDLITQTERISVIEGISSASETRLNKLDASSDENKRQWERQELRLNGLKDELKSQESRLADHIKRISQKPALTADGLEALVAQVTERIGSTLVTPPKATSSVERPKPAQSCPAYPNESMFVEELSHRLEAAGLVAKGQSTSAKLFYAALLTSPAVVSSLSGLESVVIAAINPQEDVFDVTVESNWMEPRWHDMLELVRPELARYLSSQGRTSEERSTSIPLLAFRDFDRCFPEAYLLSLLRLLESKVSSGSNTGTLLVLATRCQDSIRVVPGASVYELCSDLDFIFLQKPPSRASDDHRALCHVTGEQWREWRTARLARAVSQEAELEALCDKLEHETQRPLPSMRRGALRFLRVAATLLDSKLCLEATIAARVIPSASILGAADVLSEALSPSLLSSEFVSGALVAAARLFPSTDSAATKEGEEFRDDTTQ